MSTVTIKDKVYTLLPALGATKADCRGCSFDRRGSCTRPSSWSPPSYSDSCGAMDIVYVEDTDEGRAKYIAARMGVT